MENPTTYHALATRLHTLLEEESYSKTTMKDMEFILNSFTAYMIENDLDEYTPDLGYLENPNCKNADCTRSPLISVVLLQLSSARFFRNLPQIHCL